MNTFYLKGHQIEVGWLEQALRKAEGVKEIILVPRKEHKAPGPGRRRERKLVAFLELQEGATWNETVSACRRALQKRFAKPWERPSQYILVWRWPRNSTGGVRRTTLMNVKNLKPFTAEFYASQTRVRKALVELREALNTFEFEGSLIEEPTKKGDLVTFSLGHVSGGIKRTVRFKAKDAPARAVLKLQVNDHVVVRGELRGPGAVGLVKHVEIRKAWARVNFGNLDQVLEAVL